MIKLIATDLDGTLLYPKRKLKLLTSKNKKFLKEFIANGGKVVLVSGRNLDTGNAISKELGSKVDMIACNGSVVEKDSTIFEKSPMDVVAIKKLFNTHKHDQDIISWVFMSDKYPMIIVPCSLSRPMTFAYKMLMKLQFKYMDEHLVGKKYLETLLNDKEANIYKVMCVCGITKKDIIKTRDKTKVFIDAYGTNFEVLWSKQSIEFMNKGVNKANALKRFINSCSLKEDEVCVVGDSGNDVPLFENFTNSFVMHNASSEVKQHAKTEIKGVYCLKDYIG